MANHNVFDDDELAQTNTPTKPSNATASANARRRKEVRGQIGGNLGGMPHDVPLVDVADVVAAAKAMVEDFGLVARQLLPGAEVHHIGATALPTGLTKGDVDVNLRIAADGFAGAVEVLRRHYRPAQEHNWTPTYASFKAESYPLPFGIQVTVIGSPDDFLLALRDTMLTRPSILAEYSECKRRAAALGPDGYWAAKDTFLKALRSSDEDASRRTQRKHADDE